MSRAYFCHRWLQGLECLKAGTGPLVNGAVSWCRPTHIWGWVPTAGCGASGVPGPVPGQLGAQRVLRQLAIWWVGLCPHLASCLAWGIPIPVPTGWWIVQVACANKLEGWFQNHTCQHQYPCGRMSSPKGLSQCLWPESKHQLPPASPGVSPRSAGGSNLGSFQITAFALDFGAHEMLCASLKGEVSISYSPLTLLKVSPAGLQCQMFWGLVFPVQDP